MLVNYNSVMHFSEFFQVYFYSIVCISYCVCTLSFILTCLIIFYCVVITVPENLAEISKLLGVIFLRKDL